MEKYYMSNNTLDLLERSEIDLNQLRTLLCCICDYFKYSYEYVKENMHELSLRYSHYHILLNIALDKAISAQRTLQEAINNAEVIK
ncbi:MAG: hypothetical protein FWC97_02710 [Treponema sp.]|nr:hypothetical protein [Treponema sp.]